MTPRDAGEWLATPLGRYVLAREQTYFDHAVADIFGYNAFQFGLSDIDFLRASRIVLRCRVDASTTAAVITVVTRVPRSPSLRTRSRHL